MNKALWIAWIALLSTPGSLGAKTHVEAVKVKTFTERDDYFSCRKKVMAHLGKKISLSSLSPKVFDQCRDQYPGAAYYIDCRKQLSQKYQNDETKLIVAMRSCKEEYSKFSFDPKHELPFLIYKNEVFFAGVGLNRTKHMELTLPATGATLQQTDEQIAAAIAKLNDFGNYSCTPLTESFTGVRPAEHILIGNGLHSFSGFQKLSFAEILKTLKIKPNSLHGANDPYSVKDFGELYQLDQEKKASIFFSSSYCYFTNRLGYFYDGIKIYYLIDTARKLAQPYFAIAFYTNNDKNQLTHLIDKTHTLLGKEYQTATIKAGMTVMSRTKIKEFDDEGDPFNLCSFPREQDYVVMIKQKVDKPLYPEFLLFANLKTLCAFGDYITKKWVAPKTSTKPP